METYSSEHGNSWTIAKIQMWTQINLYIMVQAMEMFYIQQNEIITTNDNSNDMPYLWLNFAIKLFPKGGKKKKRKLRISLVEICSNSNSWSFDYKRQPSTPIYHFFFWKLCASLVFKDRFLEIWNIKNIKNVVIEPLLL
jgi:hypothetical protein